MEQENFYIVKVIDRDNEQDGPKFWRFKHNYKGEGPLDKIIPIIRSKGNITDSVEGRDLILSLTLAKAPNGREYTTINSIIQEDKSPLHNDQEVANEWSNHPDTWRDVYSVKPQEYLEMVAQDGRSSTMGQRRLRNTFLRQKVRQTSVVLQLPHLLKIQL